MSKHASYKDWNPECGQVRQTTITFKEMFHLYRNIRPHRHPELGLGWVVRSNANDSWWFIFFFDEPDLLVQELKAVEWVNKQQNKKPRKKRTENESTKVH